LPGQRSTVLALGLELAGERRQHRVMARQTRAGRKDSQRKRG
jgi:hypothetical protein